MNFMIKGMISIIIPVYNVEPYLKNCVESVMAQSYENIEIILVDDGSEDCCGSICDEYAANGHHIKVIHQKNGGLSAARNAGLRKAKGEYIGFVDSDDYVHPDMYKTLISAMSDDVDITICGRCIVFPKDDIPFAGKELKRKPEKIDKIRALELLFQRSSIEFGVYTKLFRRSILKGISFPEGYTCEDYAFTYKAIIKSSNVYHVAKNLYYNYQRPGSISRSALSGNTLHRLKMDRFIIKDIKKRFPELKDAAEALMYKDVLSVINIIRNSDKSGKYERTFNRLRMFLLTNIVSIYKNKYIESEYRRYLVAQII